MWREDMHLPLVAQIGFARLARALTNHGHLCEPSFLHSPQQAHCIAFARLGVLENKIWQLLGLVQEAVQSLLSC